jgi:D-alanyl-D-alanine carboxypeptidase
MKKTFIFIIVLSLSLMLGCSSNKDSSENPVSGNPGEDAIEVELTEQELMQIALEADRLSGNLILVNKENELDAEYSPNDLTDIIYYAKDRTAKGRFMRKEAAEAFHALSEEAALEGYEIVVTTAYRSYEFQSDLYYGYVNTKGQTWADKYSARPGTSEHQTGLAADCSSPSVGYQLTAAFGDTEEGIWLKNHCNEFGFIIRYPQGKEEITGYNYEPWHIRYVGMKAASIIKEKNWTFEEFVSFMSYK